MSDAQDVHDDTVTELADAAANLLVVWNLLEAEFVEGDDDLREAVGWLREAHESVALFTPQYVSGSDEIGTPPT